jgi:methylated-DNA-[protein]-cysteine S-methyltransferase
MSKKPNYKVFKTSLGWAGVAVSDQGICRIILPRKEKKAVERELEHAETSNPSNPSILNRAVRILRKYFSGESVIFDLPLDLRFYTEFQQTVWRAAREIPHGETRTYAWIAKKIKNPKSVRAVGQALGANPVPVIIPCHRVISSSGALGGFSGGVGMKEKLLELEDNTKVT